MKKELSIDLLNLYHGTNSSFENFSLEHCSENTSWNNTRMGVFLTNEFGIAQMFGEKVLHCQAEVSKPLDLVGLFRNADQASDIVNIIFGETLTNNKALTFLNEELDLGSYSDFLESVYEREIIEEFMSLGYDHVIGRFSEDKLEICVFEPNNIKILDYDHAINYTGNPVLINGLSLGQKAEINKVLIYKSGNRDAIEFIHMKYSSYLNSIPDKIDGIEISMEKKLNILSNNDYEANKICYRIKDNLLYRFHEGLSQISPVFDTALEAKQTISFQR